MTSRLAVPTRKKKPRAYIPGLFLARSGRMSGMPRFTIKTLLISTAMVAVGTAIITGVPPGSAATPPYLRLPLWFVAGVLIGVGVLLPLKRRG